MTALAGMERRATCQDVPDVRLMRWRISSWMHGCNAIDEDAGSRMGQENCGR